MTALFYYRANYFTIPLVAASIIFMLCALCLLSYQLYCRAAKAQQRIKPFVKLSNIACILLFIASASIDLVHCILSELQTVPLIDSRFDLLRILGDSLYFASSLLVYIILVSKLYFTFHGTVYSVSRMSLTIFISLITAMLICGYFFEDALIKYQHKYSDIDHSTSYVAKKRETVLVLLIVIDVCINALILFLFVHKFQNIVLDISMEELYDAPSPIAEQFSPTQIQQRTESLKKHLKVSLRLNTESVSDNALVNKDRKSKFIIIMTRLTILCVWQTIINQSFYLLLIWVSMLGDSWYHHKRDLNVWYSVCYGVRSFELAINALILYCNFEANRKAYQCRNAKKPSLIMSDIWSIISTTGGSMPIVEPVSEYLWLVVLGGVVCFCMAWGIGANDANAFATSVGAKAISIKQAVIIAAIFEFTGALALGATVTNTIRKKITDYDAFQGEGDVLMLGMFCALCSSALWLYIATRWQLPVSTTQSIIGAIIGFVLMAKGPQAGVWEQVMWIAIFWVASPVLSAIGSIILFLPSRTLLFRRSDSYEKTLLTWPFWVFLVFFVMILFLLMKGLKRFDLDLELHTAALVAAACGVVIAFIAWLVFIKFGLVDKFVQSRINQKSDDFNASDSDSKKLPIENDKDSPTIKDEMEDSIDGNDSGEETSVSEELVPNSERKGKKNSVHIQLETIETHQPPRNYNANPGDKSASRLSAFAKKATYGMNVDITREDNMDELEKAIHADSEKFDPKTEKAFALSLCVCLSFDHYWLQVCTASLDIFAHGSNDVANAVAPFAAMVAIYDLESISKKSVVPMWVLLIGACGMTIGLATYGYKIMQTLGVRMGAMSSTRGYSIELSSALVVILASYYGYPASTTHAQVGATVGVGLCELTRGSESKLTWKQVINWKLLAQVFGGWILTLFVAAATCAALFGLLAYSPYAGDA